MNAEELTLTPPAPLQNVDVRAASHSFAGGAALFTVGVAFLVLLGWATGIEPLKSIIPGMIVMLPMTATTFICAGAALWLLRTDATAVRYRAPAVLLIIVAFLIGFLSLVERLFDVTFGIDLLLFADELQNYPYRPVGRMASNSGLAFTFSTMALLSLIREPRIDARWREGLATAALLISSLALMGYLYRATPLYTFDRFVGMALLTAVTFTVLNVGILLARPHRGAVTLISGRDPVARLTQRLLIVTFTVPVVGGWIWLKAREAELFSREGGLAILIAFTIVSLAAVTLRSSALLRRKERAREELLVRERDLRAVAEQAQTEAERANRAKSDFLATMSHELRTPLNAIIGYASLMEESVTGDITDTQRSHLARIRLSADHLLTLIDQVLGISRVEAGKERIERRRVDITDLVAETEAIAEPLFNGSAVRLIVDPAVRVTITTDPDRVRQILLNLLSNARKFTRQGTVTLRTEYDIARGKAYFDVADTGIGISQEHLEKIFEPFWQVEMSMTRSQNGAGLGLSVSRQLARLLGGDLTVSSEVNRGSTFRLELPAE